MILDNSVLYKVHRRISPYIHKTPVFTSQLINKISKTNVFFKCENLQKMGAFKMRGAVNAILNLTKEQQNKGVVTHSSGNFAQALSLSAKQIGVKAYIVMPKCTPEVKKEAVKTYGGVIIECDSNIKSRENTAKQIQIETGAIFIHPSNNDDVILGQGTAALELLEEYPDLDYIFTPVGGGGLLAGTLLAVNKLSKNCRVVAGEPEEANDAYRSIQSGVIEKNKTSNTLADGLKTHLGDRNFPIIKKHVEKIVCVKEDEIIYAMKLIWQYMKLIVEPSSAVAFAALLKEEEVLKNKNIGLIISGGNVDLKNLPF